MSTQILTEAVANVINIPKTNARTAVDTTIAGIVSGIVDDRGIIIPGLGQFTVKYYAARDGRNPRTGEEITIAARHKVKFKPAKVLREALNPVPSVPRRRA